MLAVLAVQAEPRYHLYRDVLPAQSELAHAALDHAYSADQAGARAALDSLQAMEEARRLPPLSQLLEVAVGVMRYQNGDFETPAEGKALRESIEEVAEQGSYLCQQALRKEEGHPTYLLIQGGIRGFLATLRIHADPGQALNEGFKALKLLERSRKEDPRVKDSYMGTGIFHCTASNAPLIVRATLKIVGRSVNMRQGLESLRISAYQGQYTSVSSQLFLIQFLSPYDDEPRREKDQIFRTLESTYPANPYYTFLRVDEALCFRPDSLFLSPARDDLERRILGFGRPDLPSRRYENLVRRQYALLNPEPDPRLAPDTAFNLGDFRFYPVLLEALRAKREAQDSLDAAGIKIVLKAWKDSCFQLIAVSNMNPTRKRLYQWHVGDALHWQPRKSAPATGNTTAR